MATQATITQQPAEWDASGKPVQPSQPQASGATEWDANGKPVAPAQSQAAATTPEQSSFLENYMHPQGAPGGDENSSNLPLTSYGAATRAGLNSVANATLDAVKGAAQFLHPKPQNEGEAEAFKVAGVGGMLAHRLIGSLRDMGAPMLHPHELAAAMHEINNSNDPMGTYLEVLQKTAATGAGQALTALAGEGVVKGVGEVKAPVSAAARTGSETIADTAKGIVKGKNVAEVPAQAAIREAVGGNEPSLQRIMEKPIVEARAAKNAAYSKIAEAQEAAKPQLERIEAIDKELDGIDETLQPERAGSLEDERAAITKQLGETGGADPQLLKQANEANKTYKGMQLMEKRILKNPRIVEGDIAHGTPETVNVDRAIVELKKMETTRWGNQVEHTFGPEGASQLLDKLYAAQRAGAHAVKVRQFLKWAAIGLGASTGAVKGVEMMTQ